MTPERQALARQIIADWPEITDEQRTQAVRILAGVRPANTGKVVSSRTVVRRAA